MEPDPRRRRRQPRVRRDGWRGRDGAAERVVRPDARAVRRLQQGLRRALEEEDGPGRLDPPVARRLRQAGAHGDRRPAGRRRDARARLRHRRAGEAGQAPAGQLAGAAAQQQLAVHLDDRVPGAQGQPEEDQGLGRPRAAGRLRDHAEPEDLGRRALEPRGGLGLGAAAAGRDRADGRGIPPRSSTRTCRCSTRARAAR